MKKSALRSNYKPKKSQIAIDSSEYESKAERLQKHDKNHEFFILKSFIMIWGAGKGSKAAVWLHGGKKKARFFRAQNFDPQYADFLIDDIEACIWHKRRGYPDAHICLVVFEQGRHNPWQRQRASV